MYRIFTYLWLIFMVNVGTVNISYMDPMGITYYMFLLVFQCVAEGK